MKKMKCNTEARNEKGEKIMQFTKGNVYDFYQADEESWAAREDDDNLEVFFDLDRMFEEI